MEDLTTTISINKELISEMFLASDQKGGEKIMLRKLNQENQFLLKRVKELYKVNEQVANECLFHQQIAI